MEEGLFDVTINTPFCGSAMTEVEVVFPVLPSELTITVDTNLYCADSIFSISAEANDSDQFVWDDHFIGEYRPDVEPGMYTVFASNICGDSDPETITVAPFLCPLEGDCLAVPNVFTPNADRQNDDFGAFIQPACIPRLQSYHLRIFSRRGQLLFESFENSTRWDGTSSGAPQPPDVYSYILSYTFQDGTSIREEAIKGGVVLVR